MALATTLLALLVVAATVASLGLRGGVPGAALARRGPSRLLASLMPPATDSNELAPPPTSAAVLQQYMDELVSLRGTPELVDRLENLAQKHPGIELDLDLYRAIYPFKLDDFQEKGLSSLMAGNNVLVTTPTGSGKTVVGELAIYFALMMGLRVAYTTPLKALSNQKFQDFTNKYGGDRVGLLTGDIAINRGAPILIMTTEVFRNMIYDQDSENQLSNLFMVCFDEFHFMNDPDRGTVWEESVISCPASVRILALSATMGNVDEIKGWMTSIHGPTELVVSDHRPVPLRYLFAMKQGMMPLFRDPNAGPGARSGVVKTGGKLDPGASVNPAIVRIEEQVVKAAQAKVAKSGRPIKATKVNPQTLIPRYSDLAEELAALKMLPAIVFIFSRTGCEQSAKIVMQTKVKLLTDAEQLYVAQAIAAFARANPEIPIAKSSVMMLRAGVGVHHAGLIPVWKVPRETRGPCVSAPCSRHRPLTSLLLRRRHLCGTHTIQCTGVHRGPLQRQQNQGLVRDRDAGCRREHARAHHGHLHRDQTDQFRGDQIENVAVAADGRPRRAAGQGHRGDRGHHAQPLRGRAHGAQDPHVRGGRHQVAFQDLVRLDREGTHICRPTLRVHD